MELAVVADVETADQSCDFSQRVSLRRIIRGMVVLYIKGTTLGSERRFNRLASVGELSFQEFNPGLERLDISLARRPSRCQSLPSHP